MNFNRLKDLREDHDLTQKELSKIFGISQQQYSRYETSIRNMPIDMLYRLAEYYNTSVDYMISRTNDIRPYANIRK
ncbi:MAG: helix-turn-helix transcriptional regulator [Bacilli bacterium]